jgi:hypothetical protein
MEEENKWKKTMKGEETVARVQALKERSKRLHGMLLHRSV